MARRKKHKSKLFIQQYFMLVGITMGVVMVGILIFFTQRSIKTSLSRFTYPSVVFDISVPTITTELSTEAAVIESHQSVSSTNDILPSEPSDLLVQEPQERIETLISSDVGFYLLEPFYNPTAEEQRIRIYQKGNEVPLQILKIPFYQGAEISLQGKFIIEDINFDTYKDILVLQNIDEEGNKIYRYVFFEPQTGIFGCNDIVNTCTLTNPHIIKRTHDIIEEKICGEKCRTVFTYEFLGGQFILIQEQRYTYSNEYGNCIEVITIDPVTKYQSKEKTCDRALPNSEPDEVE